MKQNAELTVRAVGVGVVLSLAMAAANMYLGLKAGMTIAANIPCSVIALVLFNTLFRARSLAEINIAQSTGSVGEGLAAGVIFVVPALVLSKAFPDYSEWGFSEHATLTMAVLGGSILGVVLTGFLRQPMVEESKELRFPEGVATAEVLKTGEATLGEGKRQGILGIVIAFVGGILVKTFSAGVAVLQGTVSTAFKVGGSAFKLGADVSAALVGVGFIIEFNGAALVALGGALAWVVFIPLFSGPLADTVGFASAKISAMGADGLAEMVWAAKVRYIGVGGMIVGGIWSIITIRRQLVAGIRSAVSGLAGGRGAEDGDAAAMDLSRRTIIALLGVGLVLSVGTYFTTLGIVGAGIATLYTVLAVFFFVAISVYIVGLIGSTNQPVSGITICTFLLGALFLFAGRVGGAEAVKTILLVSAIVCLAACLSGTAAQNFKTAFMVKGTPRAVQTGLLVAVVVTSFLATPLLAFLDQAFTIGSPELRAPQASMFADMARGLFMKGAPMPWDMVAVGLGLAVLLIVLDEVLRRRGSSFGLSPMAVAVGIYLPFTTTLPILIGGLLHWWVVERQKDPAKRASFMQVGTVLCAGLVAGEALTGIGLAVPIGMGAQLPVGAVGSAAVRSVLSVIVLAALPVLLYLGIRPRRERSGA